MFSSLVLLFSCFYPFTGNARGFSSPKRHPGSRGRCGLGPLCCCDRLFADLVYKYTQILIFLIIIKTISFYQIEEKYIHGGGKNVFQLGDLYQINRQPGRLIETLTKVSAVSLII